MKKDSSFIRKEKQNKIKHGIDSHGHNPGRGGQHILRHPDGRYKTYTCKKKCNA